MRRHILCHNYLSLFLFLSFLPTVPAVNPCILSIFTILTSAMTSRFICHIPFGAIGMTRMSHQFVNFRTIPRILQLRHTFKNTRNGKPAISPLPARIDNIQIPDRTAHKIISDIERVDPRNMIFRHRPLHELCHTAYRDRSRNA